jgi:hypothetical protein
VKKPAPERHPNRTLYDLASVRGKKRIRAISWCF